MTFVNYRTSDIRHLYKQAKFSTMAAEGVLTTLNTWLKRYVQYPGDDQETILLKKLWWLGHIGGIPFLLLGSAIIADHKGMGVVWMNALFILLLAGAPIVYHFHRRNIGGYALVTQLGIVIISAIKVYLIGGPLVAGGAVFIGLMGPFSALIFPQKRMAIYIYLLYVMLIVAGIIFQPAPLEPYLVNHYLLGFGTGVTMIFVTLFYFTIQVDRLKESERKRIQDLDAFKTRFYTNITHEFRTPLSIIRGIAELLAENGAHTHSIGGKEGLRMIKRNTKQLLDLTNQILALSKLKENALPVRMVKADIVTYLRYLVQSFHSLATSKNIEVVLEAHPSQVIMDFDPDRMRDILVNLLSNAIKFTPQGGNVKVHCSEQGNGGRNLLIEVQDTGIGIASYDLPKVFDRYFQVASKDHPVKESTDRDGSGLGLALTKEIVNLLGGEIDVDSTSYMGTTFAVRLPISQKAPEWGYTYHESATSRLKEDKIDQLSIADEAWLDPEKLRLLIVEDHADVVNYLQVLLKDEYQISIARNGVEGMEKAIHLIPDLIITDVMMPVMDGYSLCAQLKKDLRTSHIPVVMLTAKSDAPSRLTGLEAGADAYLAKPFDPDELFIRIKKLIKLRQALQRRYKEEVLLQFAADQVGMKLPQQEISFLKKVHQIMEANLSDETFNMAALCRALGMSRSQLYRKFRALTNTTVHHFIRNLRLLKAKELLQSTDLNVSEVAQETGFKNLSHFSKVFQEKFDHSPSSFRQKQPLDN